MVPSRVLTLTSYYQAAAMLAVTLVCWLVWRAAMPSALLGGLVMTGNFIMLRFLAGKVMGAERPKMVYVVLLACKMVLALAVIALLMHTFHLNAAGFALGLATLFVGMACSMLHLSLTSR